jgi:hypothetical protein
MILAKSKTKKRKAATNQDGLLSSSTSSSKAQKSSSAAASMQQGMGQFQPSFMPAMGGYGQMMAPLSQSQFFQHAMMMGAQNSYRPQQQKQNHHMHQHSMQSVARSSSSSTARAAPASGRSSSPAYMQSDSDNNGEEYDDEYCAWGGPCECIMSNNRSSLQECDKCSLEVHTACQRKWEDEEGKEGNGTYCPTHHPYYGENNNDDEEEEEEGVKQDIALNKDARGG